MLRIMCGSRSEFRKFWKYGSPYFAASSNSRSDMGLSSHWKSLVMLYVGIGKVNIRPLLSPSSITSR